MKTSSQLKCLLHSNFDSIKDNFKFAKLLPKTLFFFQISRRFTTKILVGHGHGWNGYVPNLPIWAGSWPLITTFPLRRHIRKPIFRRYWRERRFLTSFSRHLFLSRLKSFQMSVFWASSAMRVRRTIRNKSENSLFFNIL